MAGRKQDYRCPVAKFRKMVGKELGLNEAQVAMIFDAIMYSMMMAFEEGYDEVKVLPCILVQKKENTSRTIVLNGQELQTRDYFKLVATIVDNYGKYGDAYIKILEEYDNYEKDEY